MGESSFKRLYWPSVDDFEESRRAAGLGAGTAILVGTVTGIISWLNTHGHPVFSGIDSTGYIDMAVFLVLGFAITRMSRIAALAVLGFYVYGQLEMAKLLAAHGESMRWFIPILFSINFINGIRGTLAFHELKKRGISEAEEMEAKKAEREESGEAEAMRVKQKRARIVLLVIIIAAGGFLGYTYFFKAKAGGLNAQSGSQVKISDASPSIPGNIVPVLPKAKPGQSMLAPSAKSQPAVQKPKAPPPEGSLDFKLKSGKTIRGKIVYEDDVYYSVDTGGAEEIVIKEDLKAPPS